MGNFYQYYLCEHICVLCPTKVHKPFNCTEQRNDHTKSKVVIVKFTVSFYGVCFHLGLSNKLSGWFHQDMGSV